MYCVSRLICIKPLGNNHWCLSRASACCRVLEFEVLVTTEYKEKGQKQKARCLSNPWERITPLRQCTTLSAFTFSLALVISNNCIYLQDILRTSEYIYLLPSNLFFLFVVLVVQVNCRVGGVLELLLFCWRLKRSCLCSCLPLVIVISVEFGKFRPVSCTVDNVNKWGTL